MRRASFAVTAFVMVMTSAGAAAVAEDPATFITAQPSMLDPVMSGVQITPLITVGDQVGGYTFASIPDGIAVRIGTGSQIEVYVNHETSQVPFPYNPSLATLEPGESQNDFDNAQVSKLVLAANGSVISGSFAIASSLGYQRFCSNYLATPAEGFSRDILLTNEESPDYVLRQEASWPVAIGDPNEREAGLVVALDVASGQTYEIRGMGFHNHENSVAIPGFDRLVVLSGDDTFTSGSLTIPPGGPLAVATRPAQSQLFSYMAGSTDELLADRGKLWAFVSKNPNVTDYYDFAPGSTMSVSGRFIKVPNHIAKGLARDGTEITSADVGYPPPPTNGSWQTDLRNPAVGIDGPQWVLEYWSQLNNVFQFVRVEDLAYDKRPGMGNVVYVVDSGRGRTGTPVQGLSTNGRVWRMELDPLNPRKVLSLRVFVEGDDSQVKTPGEVHQPDNIETTPTGLLLTEDPGSAQQFPVGSTDPNATTARLWYVPFAGTPQVVANVNQSADEGTTDLDPADVGGNGYAGGAFPISPGNWGVWESSGIVDASAAFGPGAFLIAVQAHTLAIEWEAGLDTPFDADADPDFNYKREGGQLLLIRIPGI